MTEEPCETPVRRSAATLTKPGREVELERTVLERRLAVFSIVAAILHFVGETWVHFAMGQFLPMLLVDYIAIGLLLFGGIRSLQTGRAAGLLCGAWGFTFCLNYRALFWRVEVLLRDGGSPALETMTQVLGGLLVVSLAAFLLSMHLCNPPKTAA